MRVPNHRSACCEAGHPASARVAQRSRTRIERRTSRHYMIYQ